MQFPEPEKFGDGWLFTVQGSGESEPIYIEVYPDIYGFTCAVHLSYPDCGPHHDDRDAEVFIDHHKGKVQARINRERDTIDNYPVKVTLVTDVALRRAHPRRLAEDDDERQHEQRWQPRR